MNGVVYNQAYYINGFKFEIQLVENARVTQNSGVVTVGDEGKVFYGVLTDIMEVKYMSSPPKILFKCIWRDIGGRGMKIDDYKFTSMNTTGTGYEDEPFIFPSQVQQVYYNKNPRNEDWSVVCRWKPRNTYEIPNEVPIENEIPPMEESEDDVILRNIEPSILEEGVQNLDRDVQWVRQELGDGVQVDEEDINKIQKLKKRKKSKRRRTKKVLNF